MGQNDCWIQPGLARRGRPVILATQGCVGLFSGFS